MCPMKEVHSRWWGFESCSTLDHQTPLSTPRQRHRQTGAFDFALPLNSVAVCSVPEIRGPSSLSLKIAYTAYGPCISIALGAMLLLLAFPNLGINRPPRISRRILTLRSVHPSTSCREVLVIAAIGHHYYPYGHEISESHICIGQGETCRQMTVQSIEVVDPSDFVGI